MDEIQQQIIQHIAQQDCSVVCIEQDDDTPPFCHTIGLFQRFRVPEILVMGLPHDTAFALLYRCRDIIRGGDVMRPMHSYGGLLKDPFRLVCREVSRDHYACYLGHARWFYAGDEFPCIQAYWPDRECRYPWEASCDEEVASAQPRLDHPWPFVGEPITKQVWTLRDLVQSERPVLRVVHEADGEWQLLSDDPEIRDEDVVLTTLGAALQRDPSLGKAGGLPSGWVAWREDVSGEWAAAPE
ncbi:MAG: DUF4262 domain-containing protein [Phycisphaerales bacterium]